MIRVVLDTNIVVSAYLAEGPPSRVVKLALHGLVKLCISDAILEEYEELLRRKSFPLDTRRATAFLRHIRRASTFFVPGTRLSISKDPDDNMFLECAQEAKAHYLITGNKKHFPTRWKYTHVLSPSEFLDIFQLAGLKREDK
ncbi:MAG: putative toxin-antitoxin system toxin component, PIN family [Acidobacteria bacterium]|nr:putative toxin-antitoxin system toxin component, PIN family [Acidobacteriota bacterium]